MRRLGCAFVALALLAACGSNPLLQMAGSNYAPLKVGDSWTYQAPAGGVKDVVSVTAYGVQQGREAYTVSIQTGAAAAAQYYVSLQAGALSVYDPQQAPQGGWFLARRLPYEPGDSWPAPIFEPAISGWSSPADPWVLYAPGSVDQTTATVSTTISAITVPPANSRPATRSNLVTLTATGATVDGTVAYAAPNVGDVEYATTDANGNRP